MQMLEDEAPDKANATASGRAVPLREFNLLRWFSLISMAVIGTVAVALGAVSTRFVITESVQRDALLCESGSGYLARSGGRTERSR